MRFSPPTPVLFLLAFVLYVACVTPDMTCIGLSGDQFRWVYCAENMESANLLGYPTYICTSWLFCQLPGNSFWNLGLFSALSTFLSGVLIYLTVKYLKPESQIAPILAALTFYSSLIVWSQSVIPEVYTPTILAATLSTYFIVTKHHYWGAATIGLGIGLHLPTFLCAAIPLYIYAHRDHAPTIRMAGITSLGLLAYLQTFICSGTTGGAGDPVSAALDACSSFGTLALSRTYARAQDAIPMILASTGIVLTLLLYLKRSREAHYFIAITLLSTSVYLWSNEPAWITYLAFSSAFLGILVGLAASKAPSNLQHITLYGLLILLIVNSGTYHIGESVDPSPTQARKVYNLIESVTTYSDIDILVISAGPEAEVIATYWEWDHPNRTVTLIKEHAVFLTPSTTTSSTITFPPLSDHSTYDNGLYTNWNSQTFTHALASLNPQLDIYQLASPEGDNYANKHYITRYIPPLPPQPQPQPQPQSQSQRTEP